MRPTLKVRLQLDMKRVTEFILHSVLFNDSDDSADYLISDTSEPVVAGGVRWTLKAMLEGRRLACYVFGERVHGEWQCTADLKMRVVSQLEGSHNHEVCWNHAAFFASADDDNSAQRGCSVVDISVRLLCILVGRRSGHTRPTVS